MLWTICVILFVLWALGMVTSYTMGGAIHVLLVIALVVLVFQIIQGRRSIVWKAPQQKFGGWVPPKPGKSGTEEWQAKFYVVSRRIKMPLLNIVLVLVVIGVALWLVNNYIPMASSIKSILNVVVVVGVGVWLLKAVGLWGSVTSYRFTH
jgi:hypothetical protein